MTRRTFLYSLWCLFVTALFLVSSIFAYSPFADGGRAPSHAGVYGPAHK